MPVVKTARDFSQMMGEAYHITLDPEDSFDWAEPSGTAFTAAREHRAELKDEAFRIVHQMAQAVDSKANTAARSGESKKRDENPEKVVVSALGELLRDHIQRVMEMAASARDQEHEWAVTGLDRFDIEDGGTWLDNALKSQSISIPSPTASRMMAKRTVRITLPDASPSDLQTIDEEIDKAEDQVFEPPDPMDDVPSLAT